MWAVLKWLGILLAVLILAVVVLIAVFDWDWVKNFIAQKGSELTGRQLSIDKLEVDWSWRPLVRVEGIRFENAAWSAEPDMVAIQRLQFRIALKELLKFRVVLPEISLTKPRVILEKNKKGEPNWTFTADPASALAVETTVPEERGEFPVIGLLTIDDGRVVYRDPGQDMDITTVVATATGETEGGRRQVEFQGEGRYQGEPFKLAMTAGSILDLRESEEPYPLRVEVTVADTEATIEGTFAEPLALQGPDLQLAVQGPDPERLYPLLGIALPSLPPYKLEGHLTRDGDTWIFRGFSGQVGDSDLSGDIAIDLNREPKFIKAELVSNQLDFDDLGGLVGAAPGTGEGETASPEQQQQAAEQEASARVLPDDDPIELDKLQAMDATVKFQGKQVIAPQLPLDDLTANLKLEGGRLTLNPLNFGIGAGRINSEVYIDGRSQPGNGLIKFELQEINLKELLARFDIAQESVGILGGRGEIAGTGTTAAKFLGSADGQIALIMAGGLLDGLLVELAGLDIGEALVSLTAEERSVEIRCAVADLQIEGGVMTAKTLVIDTTDTNIIGQGTVNFRDETLDIRLEPHPKDISLLSARSPINVTGTFKEPSVAPEAGSLAARGAVAAALGTLLTPLAALVALVDPGGGENADCQQLQQSAEN